MANFEELNDNAVAEAAGGARPNDDHVNRTNWQGAHYQPGRGREFIAYGYLWHTIQQGECLSQIAQEYHTTCQQLQTNNPFTIQNINKIYPGDAIIIRRA